MSAFRYEAVNLAGQTEQGALEADSAKHARQLLRQKQLTPLVVETLHNSGAKAGGSGLRGRSLNSAEQALLTRQLASLLTAGLPLDEALGTLIEQAERPYLHQLLTSIRAEILAGHGFASALGEHPEDFPEIYRALVSAGEQTGKLGVLLEKLADYIEQRNALTQKIKLAFIYPAIVSLVAFVIVIFLLTYVVPQVVTVFANTKQKLPLLTIGMLWISDFMRHWGWVLALALTGLIQGLRLWLKQSGPRMLFDQKCLEMPLIGKLILGYNTSRFASTLAILSQAGVPILRALQAAADTLSNRALQSNVEDAMTRVREGSSLARALAVQNRFPPVLLHLIRSGESTGKLAEMLSRAAEGERRDLERRTLFLTSLMEPLLILSMGLIVLLIVLAILMPIIEINQLVR